MKGLWVIWPPWGVFRVACICLSVCGCLWPPAAHVLDGTEGFHDGLLTAEGVD